MKQAIKSKVTYGPSAKGIVEEHIHPPEGRVAEGFGAAEVMELVRGGLPFSELEALRLHLGLSMEKLAPLLGLSRATLHRRKAEQRLGREESDKVLRYARLLGKATAVFGSEEDGRLWLSTPQFGLGEAVPLEYAETEVGAREVEQLLGRIDHGVYS